MTLPVINLRIIKKTMKKIKIGYIDYVNDNFISSIEITNSCLNVIGKFAELVRIPIEKKNYKCMLSSFRKLREYNIDYFYVNSYNFLLESFLLREKLQLDIPFIVKLNTIYPWRRKYIYSIPLIKKSDIIYSPSEYGRKAFLNIADKIKVNVIPNFIDLKIYGDLFSGVRKNPGYYTLTYLGRLIKHKGIESLIDCLPEIISEISELKLNVIGPLSGDNDSDYPVSSFVNKLKRIVRKTGLSEHVKFVGCLHGIDKYKILSDTDILINPTVAVEENSPFVITEALACGVPVIATKWAGNASLIKNGENGFLIDVEFDKAVLGSTDYYKINKKQLIDIIIKVLTNKKLLRKLKTNCMENRYLYDSEEAVKILMSFLRTKKNDFNNLSWHRLKKKSIADFKNLYNKNMLFFLFLFENLNKTFLEIYNETFFMEKTLNNKKQNKNYAKDKFLKKIQQEFLNYLTIYNL